MATDAENDNSVIFDFGAYFAHFKMARAKRHELKAEVVRLEDLRDFGASERKEKWDNRKLFRKQRPSRCTYVFCLLCKRSSKTVVSQSHGHIGL